MSGFIGGPYAPWNIKKGMARDIFKKISDLTESTIAKYETEVAVLKKELIEIQNLCPHNDVEYMPDASGNNDSSERCLDCGKEAKWLFKNKLL